VGIFVGTHIAFLLCENPLSFELGLGIVVGGASHSHGGINNSNFMLSLEGVPKLTHYTPIKRRGNVRRHLSHLIVTLCSWHE
jgi:hypothetical protein